ncbi:MAG: hypothetical protein UHX92_03635 [Acutalibacteraceae bacterium]|nr:hypothetical protein [Acutalibacteraceae bacterium]
MVKGVNKTVIEVNNTGSKMFEKIVLYVTPEYGNLSAKQLRRAASNLVLSFDEVKNYRSLRKRFKTKRILFFSAIALLSLAMIVILSFIL